MQYGKIEGVNKPVSRIVQGTNGFISTNDPDSSFRLLDTALEMGITTFDTAHIYGNGDVERIFGQWMKARNNRDDVVLIAKGAHHNADRRRVTGFDIEADIHDSMIRLQTDYFDIYMLHRDDENAPVEPVVEKLHDYQQKGVIGVYGGSNWSVERIQAANDYAAANGFSAFVCSSPNYSLADQVKEPWDNCITISGHSNDNNRDGYADTQMALFTWSSLAGGFFSGRFTRDNLESFDNYFDKVVIDAYVSDENFQRLDRAKMLAAEKEMSV
ncbi:MAG: aldo/keto reductase, partial [Aggregatilineales bacterium]